MPQKDNTKSPPEGNISPCRLSSILLDTDFWQDPKVIALMGRHGPSGAAAVLRLYCALARERGAELHFDLCIAILRKDQFAEPEELISSAIEFQLLFLDDKTRQVSHHRIFNNQLSLAKSRQRYRDYHSTWLKGRSTNSKPFNKRIRTVQIRKEKEHEKENENEKSKGGSVEAAPGVFLTPDFKNKFVEAFGADCFLHYLHSARDYAATHPRKWRTYSDHEAVLRSWRRSDAEERKGFYKHREPPPLPKRKRKPPSDLPVEQSLSGEPTNGTRKTTSSEAVQTACEKEFRPDGILGVPENDGG